MSNSVRPHWRQATRLPAPGILQARTLDWVAISFSIPWKWKVKVKSLSRVRLFATPWTAACQAPPSMGFSRQEYWSGLPLPSPHYHLDSAYSKFCISNNDLLLEPQMYCISTFQLDRPMGHLPGPSHSKYSEWSWIWPLYIHTKLNLRDRILCKVEKNSFIAFSGKGGRSWLVVVWLLSCIWLLLLRGL